MIMVVIRNIELLNFHIHIFFFYEKVLLLLLERMLWIVWMVFLHKFIPDWLYMIIYDKNI